MLLGLTTACATAVAHDPDRVVELLARAGADGVELDASLEPWLLDELRRRLGSRGESLPIWSVENVCPDRREAAAELGARDRDEARTAVAAARATLELAADLGAEFVVVRLGEVASLKSAWPSLRRAFRRGELDEAALARRARERAAVGATHLDGLRRSLEALGRIADGLGVRIGVRNPARLIGLPSAMELRVLAADLAGAPIVPVWDVPAMHLAACFGVPVDETAAAWASAPLVRLGDACGHLGGLPAGMGELDLGDLVRRLAPDARAVFPPWRGLDEHEIAAALPSLRALVAAARATAPRPGA